MRHNHTSQQINRALLDQSVALLNLWLPNGKRQGKEYIALNPTRNDRNLGSFRINTRTGQWADFATGDKGGDLISLYAYIKNTNYKASMKQLIKRGSL